MTVDVSTIYLWHTTTHTEVEAELRDAIEDQQIADWRNTWKPAFQPVLEDLLARKVPIQQWPQSWHWQWDQKVAKTSGLLAFRTFCVVCGGATQGLMRVDLTRSCRHQEQEGKPLVYIDYLEVAPWNRQLGEKPALYRGVGSALVAAAIELSNAEGFKGRIGLHSLPQADEFYRKRCKMSDLGHDTNCQGLCYFEMTQEQATKYLAEDP